MFFVFKGTFDPQRLINLAVDKRLNSSIPDLVVLVRDGTRSNIAVEPYVSDADICSYIRR